MKRIMLLLVPLLLSGAQMLQAQRTISGTVISSEDNQGIPGATVMVKGTTTGTTTNVMGQYSITVPSEATTLVFSFMGMETQEISINGQTAIDVVMKSSAQALEGVVVTALGISRSEKSLSYAVTQVDNQELVKGGDRSALNALQSKVAGVSITSNSGAPGSSSRIVVRGYSSIGGNNEPLFVIDGVPVANNASGGGSVDFGNAINDINSNDIETLTVLKGAAASALYGSRAANGVILITTKSGAARDKIKVDYAGTVNFTNYMPILQQQNTFGQGWGSVFAYDENGSWGPKFDGKERLYGRVIDGQQMYKPFVAQPDNTADFYETGVSFNNSISLSGGNEKTTFYASYSNISDNGIIPTNVDSYTRNAFTLNAKTKGKRMTISGSINYMQKSVSSVAGGQQNTVFNTIMQTPRDFSIVDMADYKNKFYDINGFYTPYDVVNPYWVINENGNKYDENHVFGNVTMDMPLTKWVSFNARLGNDFYTGRSESWTAIVAADPWSKNYNGTMSKPGGYSAGSIFRNELNGDAYLSFNPEINDFSINGIVGLNIRHGYGYGISSSVGSLILPDFYSLANTSGQKSTSSSWNSRRLVGVYAQADIGYKRQLFLNVSARNDWSSTLPKEDNNFFYPAVGLSWLFTETFTELQNIVSFGKIRASYGQTGNDPGAYALESVAYAFSGVGGGYGAGLQFPFGGVSPYAIGNGIGNPSLKPELTKEWEAGLDVRFLQERISVDVAVYKRNTVNQIMSVPIANATGYGSAFMNIGDVENKGVELLLRGTPVLTKDLRWDVGMTYTKNNNTVLALTEGTDRVGLGGPGYQLRLDAVVGKPFATFYGRLPQQWNGKTVVNPQGLPLKSTEFVDLGQAAHDYVMGFNTSVTYRGFYFSAQFDYRKGGVFYSRTATVNDFVGNSIRSTYNDRNPFIVPNSVMVNPLYNPEDPNSHQYIENTTAITKSNMNTFWNAMDGAGFDIDKNSLLDKTSFRARELVLGYHLPSKYLSKTPFTAIDFSIVARNLFVWVPSTNSFIDPDVSSYGNGVGGQIGEFSAYPSTRSWGFSIKVSL